MAFMSSLMRWIPSLSRFVSNKSASISAWYSARGFLRKRPLWTTGTGSTSPSSDCSCAASKFGVLGDAPGTGGFMAQFKRMVYFPLNSWLSFWRSSFSSLRESICFWYSARGFFFLFLLPPECEDPTLSLSSLTTVEGVGTLSPAFFDERTGLFASSISIPVSAILLFRLQHVRKEWEKRNGGTASRSSVAPEKFEKRRAGDSVRLQIFGTCRFAGRLHSIP